MNQIISKISNILRSITEPIDLKIADENPKKIFYSFLIPIFLSSLCLTIYGFTDSIFVAESGKLSLIAVGIIQSIFLIVSALGNGLSVVTVSLLSYAIGKNQMDKLHSNISSIFIITIVAGILSSVIMCLFLEPLLNYINIYGAYEYALTYGYILFLGNIFFIASAVFPGILKAGGDVVKSSTSLVLTAFLNIILDYFLIHVLEWGVFGAGIATVFSAFLASWIMFYYILENKLLMVHVSDLFKYDFKTIKNVVINAVPIAFESGVLSLSAFIFNMIFNIFASSVDLAVFIALVNVLKLVNIPIISIADASISLSSYFYGSNNFKSFKYLIKYELKLAIVCAIVLYISLFVISEMIAGLYGSSLLFINNFVKIMPIYMIVLVVSPIKNLGFVILQSLQKYYISFIMSVMQSLLLQVMLAIIFYYMISNVFGIFMGIAIGEVLGSFLTMFIAIRFLNKTESNMNMNVK